MINDLLNKACVTVIVPSNIEEDMRKELSDFGFLNYSCEYRVTNEKAKGIDFTVLEYETLKAYVIGVLLVYATSIPALLNYRVVKRPNVNDYVFMPRDRYLRKLK